MFFTCKPRKIHLWPSCRVATSWISFIWLWDNFWPFLGFRHFAFLQRYLGFRDIWSGISWQWHTKNFFNSLSRVRYHAYLSSYAILAITNDAISRKWPKTTFHFGPNFDHFWPFLGQKHFSRLKEVSLMPKS